MATVHCKYDKLVDPKSLKDHPKNRNKHGNDQIEKLAKMYEYHGIRHPIIVSSLSGAIVAGHGRKLAAIRAGVKEFPVVYQNFESAEKEYAFVQSDNAIALWADLDLEGINQDIGSMPDLNIDWLGIKDFSLDVAEKEGLTDPDEVPEVVEPKAKIGQIYKLGEHRLMCGDSTSIESVEKLMDGHRADMVFTDPPYNTGMSSKKNNGSTWLNHMFDDDYTDEEWMSFIQSFCENYLNFSKENSAHYVCLNWKRSHELVPEYIKNGFKFSNLIVWDKMVHGLGSDYKYTHEYIHLFKKGKPEIDSHQGEKEYQDIWHIQRKIGKDDDHATKKPIELVERALKHASQSNHLCLDLFGGSGSTLIACEKTNRKCFMMELDPHYVDVIIARWEKFTGKKAELING